MKQIDLQKKIRNKFIKQGVKMIDPNTVYFSKDTKIGKNVTIEPFVVIGSKVKIKDNAKILSCLLYTSPSPRDLSTSRMPSSA